MASVLGFLGRESVAEFAKLTSEMNSLKTKKVWVPGDWTAEMQSQFDLLTPPAGIVPPPRGLLVELVDTAKPTTDPSNIRVICPPGLRSNVVEMYHTLRD